MGRKRKAAAVGTNAVPADDVPDTQTRRVRLKVNSYEDVAGSDDEFHINRDKALLGEGDDARRRRQWNEKDEFLQQSDEEVLRASHDEDDMSGEDEEFATPEEDLQSDDASSPGARPDDEEDEGHWGDSKRDYYDADLIETEQDALDEETEARRLQQKKLKVMSAADFGFDEDDWRDGKPADATEQKPRTVTETLPQLQISEDMTAADKLKLLKTRYPEFEPLSNDFLSLQGVVRELETKVQTADGAPVSTSRIKHRAAVAYLAALTMYFALLTSPADDLPKNGVALAPNTIRAHPVMDSLLACRKLWVQVKDMPDDDDDDDDGQDEDEEEDRIEESASVDGEQIGETEQSQDDSLVKAHSPIVTDPTSKKTRGNKDTKLETAAAAIRAEKLRQTTASLADLDALMMPSTQSSKTTLPESTPNPSSTTRQIRPIRSTDDSDLEDESAPRDTLQSARAAAEKAAKRKSLRFYTSQIANTANRRGQAGRAAGGDDDVPRRERIRDRQERLAGDAAKRGREEALKHEALGSEGEEDGDADRVQNEIATRQREDAEGYYDLIAGRTAGRKADRVERAEQRASGVVPGLRPAETVDGKRAVGYAIEKNKGLKDTGRGRNKKKDVSNPRVKKRIKYEAKKKKLASMKPVYKGGEGRGGYGGELTGIKSNVIKSTRL